MNPKQPQIIPSKTHTFTPPASAPSGKSTRPGAKAEPATEAGDRQIAVAHLESIPDPEPPRDLGKQWAALFKESWRDPTSCLSRVDGATLAELRHRCRSEAFQKAIAEIFAARERLAADAAARRARADAAARRAGR
jgi:hypothetical protein